MRMADRFEHFQLSSLNDRNGLWAFDRRKSGQKILHGFAAFQGVDQILQRNAGAHKYRRAAEDFRIRMYNAFQIIRCHDKTAIPPAVRLSPANVAARRCSKTWPC
jgi:hypothetical protein